MIVGQTLGVSSSFKIGMTGIQAGLNKLDQVAVKIAAQDQGEVRSNEFVVEQVESLQAEHQILAATKVVASVNETLGYLLDIKV